MRKRLVTPVLLFAGAMFFAPRMPAQTPAAKSGDANSADSNWSAHDISGMWEFFNKVPGQGIYATPSKTPPPMTAWAQARYAAAKPGYGPKAQAGGNDPILHCDPSGIPRVLFFPQPFDVIQTPDRVVMFFEREHLYRTIWLNRRTHPDDATGLWIGDSVGWWEGDTFVVDTVGFNDKTWLDFYGDPHSDQMHLIERWKRVDKTTLALNFTVEDPKAYTKPWVSDTKLYKLLPKKDAVMDELFCIPEEEDAFTNRIRMPAVKH